MDEKYRKTLRTILVVLIAVCIVIAAAFLLLLAPAFVETTMPVDSYVIEIDGLGSLAVNGTATVMIPIPANADGEPVMPEGALTDRQVGGWQAEVREMPEGALTDRQVGGWQAEVRETPYGMMLAFTTTERYAPDILLPSGVRETKEEPRLLAPVLATPGNASVAEFCQLSGGTYTTVVFIDGFRPGNATPIAFTLEYKGGAGMKHLVKEDTWTTTVHAQVASTESGFVPVQAEYRVIAGGIHI
jgi:hypothetical protein